MSDITVTTDNNGVATFHIESEEAREWATVNAFEFPSALVAFKTDIRVAEYIVEQAKHEGLEVKVVT